MVLDWILGGAQLAASLKQYQLAREQWEHQKKLQEENYQYQLKVFDAQLHSYQRERALRASNAEYLRSTAKLTDFLGEDDLKVAQVDAIRYQAQGQRAQFAGATTLARHGTAGRVFLGEQLAAQGASGISIASASSEAVRAATREGFRQEAEDIATSTQEEVYASSLLALQSIRQGTRARFAKRMQAKDLRRQALNELATGATKPIKPTAPIIAPGPSALPYIVSGFQGLYSAYRNMRMAAA